MEPADQMNQMREQVVPRLQEFGMEAFVIVGYVRLEGDVLQRVCIANDGGNPAYQDGLRPVIHFASMWSNQVPNLPRGETGSPGPAE